MIQALKWWWCHDAEWWEFWFPQSGARGGGIIGVALFIIIFTLVPR
jgi:hypothetical protein